MVFHIETCKLKLLHVERVCGNPLLRKVASDADLATILVALSYLE